MRLISKVIIVLTSLALMALVLVWSLTQTLANPAKVSGGLAKAGVYTQGADVLRDSFATSLKTANVSGPNVDEILKAGVTPDGVRQAAKPALQSLVEWLTTSSPGALNLSLDLSSIKAHIVREARLRSSLDVSFVVTREVPDQFSLVDQKSTKNFGGIQAGYQRATSLMLPLTLGVLVGIGLLILLAIRRPAKRLAWPGWVLVLAAILGLGLSYIAPAVLEVTALHGGNPEQAKMSKVGLSLVSSLLAASNGIWYTLVIVGFGLVASSFVIGHQSSKKDKKHKK